MKIKRKILTVAFATLFACGSDPGPASGPPHQLCVDYRQRWVDYASACGAAPSDAELAADLEIARLSSGGTCADVVGTDESAVLNECLPALESILLDCASPDDFWNRARAEVSCLSINWKVRP